MVKRNFNHLGEIEITADNCEQIFAEATQLLTLAIEVNTINEYERRKSVDRSISVKRGIQWKKENGLNRRRELGTSK